jgi:hypothetical protein
LARTGFFKPVHVKSLSRRKPISPQPRLLRRPLYRRPVHEADKTSTFFLTLAVGRSHKYSDNFARPAFPGESGTVRAMSIIPRKFLEQKQPLHYLYAELVLAGALTGLIHTAAGST